MYDMKPNLIIGFHGCERGIRDQLLMNPNEYKISQKPFDWLGHGLYFWENNYDRALEWAEDKKQRSRAPYRKNCSNTTFPSTTSYTHTSSNVISPRCFMSISILSTTLK